MNINNFCDLPKEFNGNENHFYGRMINLDIENEEFRAISQIGKIAIFMSQTLKKIYQQISQFENNKVLIFRLDEADQNYSYCKNFIKKLDLDLLISKKKFLLSVPSIFNKKITYGGKNFQLNSLLPIFKAVKPKKNKILKIDVANMNFVLIPESIRQINGISHEIQPIYINGKRKIFSGVAEYGHIISEKNGGKALIDNLIQTNFPQKETNF